jgi:glycosyltransferase involved in cell wall biosynthesis
VVTSNEAFPRVFTGLGAHAPPSPPLVVPGADPAALAAAVAAWLDLDAATRDAAGGALAELVRREHSVDPLMARLVARMEAAR